MIVFYSLLIGSMIVLGGSAIYALAWAARTGQFRNMKGGARTIFDEEEFVGRVTDVFPGIDLEKELQSKRARRAERMKTAS